MKKRNLAILLVIAMLCSMLSSMALLAGAEESSEGSSTGFVDVPDDAYYKDAVEWAVANGITAGTSPTTFGPKDACTRAQTMTFLWSAKGKPTVERENPFTDISADKYYYDAVLWAVDNGITSGMTPTTFGPKVTCTRAQVVTFLWHAMGDPVVERDNPFTDVPEDSYFHDAVLWAVENGVTAGTSETTFSPKAPCTRAQIVTFLYKALAEEEEAPDERLNEYGLAKIVEDGAILHAWCWNFNTIKEMIPQIAAAGFSAVQTSPINSIIVGENGGLQIVGQGKWYYHYQPTEYEVIGNYQLGTDEEFRQMCEVAHSYGVKIIVDQVVNHMTATESAISTKIRNEIDWGEPGEWGNPSKPWTHKSTGTNWSERDRFEETQNSLSGLIEWNTQNPNVQQYILRWLQTCVEAGADGFRYDAAKLIELPDDVSIYHPEYNFASEFWPTVLQNGASFQYGEVLQEGEPNHRWQDVPNVVSGYNDEDSSRLHAYQDQTFQTKDGEEKHFNTTLSFYGWRLRDAIHNGNLNAAYVGDMLVPEGASADRTVTWVESHDNYINDHSYNELDEQQVIQAWAILAARKEGTPLFFSRPMNATASSPYGNNLIGPEGSHFFMDSQVVAVNFFRNEMGSAEEFVSNPTGTDDLVMIERGDKGAVIVNVRNEDIVLEDAPVQSMADGTYTDQVFGGTFTVSDGKISGTLRAGKVAVVYNSQLQGRLDFAPEITLSVPTSEFITDTLEVTISMRGIDHASYTVNDGEPAEAVNGTVVTIGEGMENDDVATLLVTGFNAEGEQVAQASAIYTKRGYRADTMVFVEDAVRVQRGWGSATVHIYLWGGNGTNNGSWPGVAAELQTEGEWSGYWKYVLPYELENEAEMHVIVNNGSGGGNNQIERNDMLIHPGEIKVMNADEEWLDASELSGEPRVYMAPGDGASFRDTLEVTLYAVNCETAKYQIDDGTPVEFENGDVITIGAELSNNETVTLTLFGYNAAGEQVSTDSATYVKRIYNGDTTIYIDPAVRPDWTNFCIYVYPDNGHGWPGVQQADLVEEDGLLVWLLPEDLQYSTLTVIFSDGGFNQVEQGWTIGPDEHKIWRADGSDTGVWEDYVPEFTPGIVYVEDGYQGWSAYAVHAWNAPTDELSEGQIATTWPGVVSELQTEGEWAGYWKSVLPDEFEGLEVIKIIINNNGSGSQQDAGTMAWGETKVMTKEGEWLDASELSGEPRVYMAPGDGASFRDTLEVTLYAVNCETAKYQIDDGTPVEFENGDVITIGAELSNNETVTLTLFGYNAAGEQVSTDSATYVKRIYNGDTTIYIDPAVRPDWTNFCIYVYASDGDHGHGWPGVQQADLEEEDDLLVWVLPTDLQGLTLTIIFSNGGSNQVEQGWTIGPDQQKIWRADGSANGVWEDYTPG